MSNIWFDVSSILEAKSSALRSIRAEVECAEYALRYLGKRVKFCRFDSQTGYLAVDAEFVERVVAALAAGSDYRGYPYRQAKVRSSIAVKTPTSVRLVAALRRVLGRLPQPIERAVISYLTEKREAGEAAIRALAEFRQALALWRRPAKENIRRIPKPQTQSKSVKFLDGDTYISLQRDWSQRKTLSLSKIKVSNEIKTIFFCHDLISINFPHFCATDQSGEHAHRLADLTWYADEFICVSQCTRKDLLSFFDKSGVPPRKITVINPGSETIPVGAPHVSSHIKDIASERFILFVSNIECRKNHETLYRAYLKLIERGEGALPKLIFVGEEGCNVNDFLRTIELDPRIRHIIYILSNVSAADLSWLYQKAYFTVFPSLYEGWADELVDCLSAGKFCLASNAASIPEAGGSLVEYIDPWDVPRWAERLDFYFNNPDSIKIAEARVSDEYKPLTWEEAGKQIFQRANALRVE